MQLTTHVGNQQSWQKHAHAYLGDIFDTGIRDEVVLAGYDPVEDGEEHGKGGLESAEERRLD